MRWLSMSLTFSRDSSVRRMPVPYSVISRVPLKEFSRGVDQPRDFLWTEHRRQRRGLSETEELAEMWRLSVFTKKNRNAATQFTTVPGPAYVLQQMGLILPKLVGPSLSGDLPKWRAKSRHDRRYVAGGDLGVVTTLEFLQHHFA